ncbi:hypothetical protein [Streptomyces sp. NPDC055036]
MVSLDKTRYSISYGRMHARIGKELRKNNLVALSLEFGERAYRVEAASFEAYKATTLSGA